MPRGRARGGGLNRGCEGKETLWKEMNEKEIKAWADDLYKGWCRILDRNRWHLFA